jgi:hypothetical protein
MTKYVRSLFCAWHLLEMVERGRKESTRRGCMMNVKAAYSIIIKQGIFIAQLSFDNDEKNGRSHAELCEASPNSFK